MPLKGQKISQKIMNARKQSRTAKVAAGKDPVKHRKPSAELKSEYIWIRVSPHHRKTVDAAVAARRLPFSWLARDWIDRGMP